MEMWKFNRDRSEERYAQRQINHTSGGYAVTEDKGVYFLTASWNNRPTEKFLVLTVRQSYNHGEYAYRKDSLLLYKANGAPYFYGEHVGATYDEWKKNYDAYDYLLPRGSMLGRLVFGTSAWIQATSTLTEGRTVYSTDKLGRSIGECWVEGVSGQGINERLSLKLVQWASQTIYLSSGFVNFEKPYLYRENSRIKRIRVSDASGRSRTIDLKDTPHFQPIDLTGMELDGESWYGSEYSLFIDIVDVYPGTKYTDTCVNSLCYPFGQ
jgi:hypothetical protein